MDDPENATPPPRRSLRSRGALTEINDLQPNETAPTPKSKSPDEEIIIQRGPRKKPLTWSPYEYNKTKILGPPRDVTPERIIQKPDINSKLRRRLIMSPNKTQQDMPIYVSESIARRLRSFKEKRNVNNEQ